MGDWTLKDYATGIGLILLLGGILVNVILTWASWNAHILSSDEFHAEQLKFNDAQIELNTAARIEQEVKARIAQERNK